MVTLAKKVAEFRNSHDAIKKRRNLWNESTRDLILNNLNEIVKEFDLDWHAYVNDSWKNGETVILTFGNCPSGIIEENDKRRKSFIKNGGVLIFSQVYNGEVYVIIKKPFVEDMIAETNSEFIEKISPENITKEFVETKVIDFLQKMIDWENFENN